MAWPASRVPAAPPGTDPGGCAICEPAKAAAGGGYPCGGGYCHQAEAGTGRLAARGGYWPPGGGGYWPGRRVGSRRGGGGAVPATGRGGYWPPDGGGGEAGHPRVEGPGGDGATRCRGGGSGTRGHRGWRRLRGEALAAREVRIASPGPGGHGSLEYAAAAPPSTTSGSRSAASGVRRRIDVRGSGASDEAVAAEFLPRLSSGSGPVRARNQTSTLTHVGCPHRRHERPTSGTNPRTPAAHRRTSRAHLGRPEADRCHSGPALAPPAAATWGGWRARCVDAGVRLSSSLLRTPGNRAQHWPRGSCAPAPKRAARPTRRRVSCSRSCYRSPRRHSTSPPAASSLRRSCTAGRPMLCR